ncbi:type VI secretion system baseplate subunit TssK [Roseibium aquae]|uniref:type VI secretion system baseplate subunit TssK n=1 Tax=Roseibium aquae TaxID=1323746 RepID=UPI002452D54E|nr:type VI secretion system baseplate subunit TssK [Roseibium aquae]
MEGMFLRPQHLQQHDRWVETSLEQRVKNLSPFTWGVRRLEFDPDAMQIGQLRVAQLDAILPDGTVFSTAQDHRVATAREVRPEHQGKKVYLSVPLHSAGNVDVSVEGSAHHRYGRSETEIVNSSEADRPTAVIAVGQLTGRLVLEGESLDEATYIALGEIEAVDAQGSIQLAGTFIPPVLYVGTSRRIINHLEEVRSLLRKRAEILASNASGEGTSSRAGLLDLMMLGAVNRYEVLLTHMITCGLHAPEQVYRELLALAGEIATYGTDSRRPPELPVYDHRDLRATFQHLLAVLRDMLSFVVEQNAVSIPLTKRDYGVWLGDTSDKMVFENREFVLIAHANVSLEVLRTQMPIQIKIGPVEKIRELVNLQLPGVGITPLSVAPRQIPYIQNAVYFSLDVSNELWPQFQTSAAFALHLSGDYPGLGLELWAIQKGQ